MNVLQNVKGSYIRGKTPIIENKCMNCRKIIEDPLPGPEGRRFCSNKCKNEYMKTQ